VFVARTKAIQVPMEVGWAQPAPAVRKVVPQALLGVDPSSLVLGDSNNPVFVIWSSAQGPPARRATWKPNL